MTFDGRFFGFVVSIDHSEVNTATRHSIVHMLPEYSDVCFHRLRVDTLINSCNVVFFSIFFRAEKICLPLFHCMHPNWEGTRVEIKDQVL